MLSWVFAYIYVMTLGGPMNSTVVTEYYIYQQVLHEQRGRRRRGRRAWSCSASSALLIVARVWLGAALAAMAMSSAAGSAVALRRRPRRIGAGASAASAAISCCSPSALLALLPIYFMVVNAFKTKPEYHRQSASACRCSPVLSSLTEALAGGDLYRWLLNSFLITAASVLVSTALAALGRLSAEPDALARSGRSSSAC